MNPRLVLMVGVLACMAIPAVSNAAATVREYTQVMTTYPFSDPDPVPAGGRIYPYYRFDGYTDVPVQQAWTVVELENEFIRLRVLPGIGGKIWSAVDKTTGRAFIYDNHVVKFRDIAMRGPWTSGGIEANYGIIGHTPNCATPVDYVARTAADGSASVTIGVLDLLTRTSWRLEITLPADAAYFTTRSLWQNTSSIEQPYYTWMNAGLKASGNLQFIYPGTHYLGHGGEVSPWPIHPVNGKDLSFYEQNDFGPYKSYHVFGRGSDFFGAYWHDDDAGMARYSTRDDKAGKKIWIWGLSQQGMIWERLLTDADGQYVEVQSGRLFNQAAPESSLTPFKNRGFLPGATDVWTEYWLPVKGTRGFVKANDLGALNVRREQGRLVLAFSPAQRASGEVEVFDGPLRVATWPVAFTPLATWTQSLPVDVPDARLRVRVLGSRFEYAGDPSADTLARPRTSPSTFDWSTVFGLHTRAKELIRQRRYVEADDVLQACLAKDPHYVPALVDASMLRLRAGDDARAFALAQTALSIDTYEPAANYYYALAADALGRTADARDGFEMAAQASEFRGAAWQQLARLALAEGRIEAALHYAGRLTNGNALDVAAWQLTAVARRVSGDTSGADATRDRLLAVDPLNHVARFERALALGTDAARQAFVGGIRNEMPHETFLEMAAWYRGVGRSHDAEVLLALAPRTPEILYWRAYLASVHGRDEAAALLKDAHAASPALVFPFRRESVDVFAWAAGQGSEWQPRYYLALIDRGRGNLRAAREALVALGDAPTYAPLYALRASLHDDHRHAAADLRRALALDPSQWRFGRQLAELHIAGGRYREALEAARDAWARAPANYVLGMLTAQALVLSGQPADALAVLDRIAVLPYEGADEGRRLFREAHVLMAVEALASDPRKALDHLAAGQAWPAHLGAGKPYEADIDQRVDDWVAERIHMRAGAAADAAAARDRILDSSHGAAGPGGLVSALVLRGVGRVADAQRAIDAWAATVTQASVAAWGRAVWDGTPLAFPLGRHEAGDYAILDAALHAR